jgi:hypothetical protein
MVGTHSDSDTGTSDIGGEALVSPVVDFLLLSGVTVVAMLGMVVLL